MTTPAVPFATVRTPHRMVASADGLATQAGLALLARGGNAVDAADRGQRRDGGHRRRTSAGSEATCSHWCTSPASDPAALNASGRAGSGSDASELRAAGHVEMPLRHDVRTVTVPGCVDGWMALHQRFGRRPLAEVLAPAIGLADDGFPASPLLVGALTTVDDAGRVHLDELARQATRPGARVRRPGVGADAAGDRR